MDHHDAAIRAILAHRYARITDPDRDHLRGPPGHRSRVTRLLHSHRSHHVIAAESIVIRRPPGDRQVDSRLQPEIVATWLDGDVADGEWQVRPESRGGGAAGTEWRDAFGPRRVGVVPAVDGGDDDRCSLGGAFDQRAPARFLGRDGRGW